MNVVQETPPAGNAISTTASKEYIYAGSKLIATEEPSSSGSTIGLYRPNINTFYLRNSNTTGPPDITVPFGANGDIPIVGDWNGDGTTTVGLFRPTGATFYLRNTNSTGSPD